MSSSILGLFNHIVQTNSNTTPSAGDRTTIILIIAIIGILPGIFAVWLSYETRRDKRHRQEEDESNDLTKLGADILTREIERLTKERTAWETERTKWMEDKVELLQKINTLSSQLRLTNMYLVAVLDILQNYKIDAPPIPPTLKLGGAED